MTHREPRPERWPLGYGRRTRAIVAIVGGLLSVAVPVVVLGAPGLLVEEQVVRPPDDPAGLGITGTLPDDQSLSDQATEGAGDSGLSRIPTPPDLPDGPLGIPGAVLDAYQFAERTLVAIRPSCHLRWSVLAGIGRIESNHASYGRVDAFGNTRGPILGPRLDGSPGMAAIPDTDHGALDGDTVWDRAVGPMQFIPSSWRSYGVDGNGDGVANPNNVYDSTIATGAYLCAGGTDLSDPAQLHAAVFRYNHSESYVNIVLLWERAYRTGVISTQSAPGPVPSGPVTSPGVAAQAAAATVAAPPTTSPAPTLPAPTSNPPVPPTTTTVPTSSPPPTTTTTAPTSSSPPLPTVTVPPPTTSPPVSSTPPLPPEVPLPTTDLSPAPASTSAQIP